LPVHDPLSDEIEPLLDLMIAVAKEAGAIAMSFFGQNVKTWTKVSDDKVSSPVSEADLAVNAHLKQALLGAHPDFGWLSEESEDDPARRNKTFVWVVDPIDGTRAFLRGQPHFTICIALLSESLPIAGVVFNPALDELFHGRKGNGAFLNGKPIYVSEREQLEGCRMIGFDGTFKSQRWRQPWPKMAIEQRNSMAYRLALVASGAFDATVAFSQKHDWDLAAADIIVQEAGGVICHGDGSPVAYNRESLGHSDVVACGPALRNEILAQLKRFQPS